MKTHHRQLGQGASWVKFRRRMFIAINKLNLLPKEKQVEADKLRQYGTRYRLPEVARPKRQTIVVTKPVHAPTTVTISLPRKRPGTFLTTPSWRKEWL